MKFKDAVNLIASTKIIGNVVINRNENILVQFEFDTHRYSYADVIPNGIYKFVKGNDSSWTKIKIEKIPLKLLNTFDWEVSPKQEAIKILKNIGG